MKAVAFNICKTYPQLPRVLERSINFRARLVPAAAVTSKTYDMKFVVGELFYALEHPILNNI